MPPHGFAASTPTEPHPTDGTRAEPAAPEGSAPRGRARALRSANQSCTRPLFKRLWPTLADRRDLKVAGGAPTAAVRPRASPPTSVTLRGRGGRSRQGSVPHAGECERRRDWLTQRRTRKRCQWSVDSKERKARHLPSCESPPASLGFPTPFAWKATSTSGRLRTLRRYSSTTTPGSVDSDPTEPQGPRISVFAGPKGLQDFLQLSVVARIEPRLGEARKVSRPLSISHRPLCGGLERPRVLGRRVGVPQERSGDPSQGWSRGWKDVPLDWLPDYWGKFENVIRCWDGEKLNVEQTQNVLPYNRPTLISILRGGETPHFTHKGCRKQVGVLTINETKKRLFCFWTLGNGLHDFFNPGTKKFLLKFFKWRVIS